MPKPIERHPKDTTLPRGWHAVHNYGIPYRPKDKINGQPFQEDWESVARKFNVDVRELIWFNYMTNNPDEVNWYLHYYYGADKVSPSGNNWMFSNSANPGIIYIPPADDTNIDFDPVQVCVWMPDNIKKFMMRLFVISQGMSGNKGQRIKTLVRVILQAGYPKATDLWYYNDMVVTAYVDFKTDNAKRRDMTKATGGAFPFDGDSGLYSQSLDERGRGKWRIHPVPALFDEFSCGHDWDPIDIKDRLEEIEEEMYKGWHELDMINGKAGGVGGNIYSEMTWDFIDHVRHLSEDDTHLYSAFRQ